MAPASGTLSDCGTGPRTLSPNRWWSCWWPTFLRHRRSLWATVSKLAHYPSPKHSLSKSVAVVVQVALNLMWNSVQRFGLISQRLIRTIDKTFTYIADLAIRIRWRRCWTRSMWWQRWSHSISRAIDNLLYVRRWSSTKTISPCSSSSATTSSRSHSDVMLQLLLQQTHVVCRGGRVERIRCWRAEGHLRKVLVRNAPQWRWRRFIWRWPGRGRDCWSTWNGDKWYPVINDGPLIRHNMISPMGRPLTGAVPLELIASCDWYWDGFRMVPKLLCDGNTGPPGAGGATGGDLGRIELLLSLIPGPSSLFLAWKWLSMSCDRTWPGQRYLHIVKWTCNKIKKH